MAVTLGTTLRRNAELFYSAIGSEEALMMSPSGRYFGFNAVGRRIWELLETPQPIAQLCTRICEEFEVDAPTCETSVLKFVNELIANGIVHEAEA